MKKKIRYAAEGFLIYLLYYGFSILSFEAASKLGAKMACLLGKRLKVTNTARRNLENAFPEMSKAETEEIIHGMWENLGRTVGELPHMPGLTGDYLDSKVDLIGLEHIENLENPDKGFIIFGGHLGNWEIGSNILCEKGYSLASVYRKANNPYAEKLIQKSRANSNVAMFPKGKAGARQLLKHLSKGGSVGMLVDQKMNDGIAVPFFGRDAMTAPAIAELSKKFNIPLIPSRIERCSEKGKKTTFRVTIFPPLVTEGRTSLEIMTEVNILLEEWIKARPEQWLWLHKRWPDIVF